jgi:outer membrane autotransporter protein
VPACVVLPFVPGFVSEANAQCGNFSQPACPTVTVLSSATAAQLEAITATSVGIARNEVRQVEAAVTQRLRDISRDLARGLPPGTTAGTATVAGLSAGSDPTKYAAWLDSSGSYLSNDNAIQGSQGRSWDVLSGVDAVLGENWVVGVTTGYNAAALSINAFGSGGNRRSSGFVIGPYASYVFNQNWSVDCNLNYTRLENTVVTPGSAKFGGNRYTVGANANYYTDLGPVALTGYGGYTYAYEHNQIFNDDQNSAFPASSIYYGAFKVGFEASWPIGKFEPYLPFTYEYETTTPRDGTGRNDVVVGLGLRYSIGDALKLGIVATTTQLKSHAQEDTIAANLRYSF